MPDPALATHRFPPPAHDDEIALAEQLLRDSSPLPSRQHSVTDAYTQQVPRWASIDGAKKWQARVPWWGRPRTWMAAALLFVGAVVFGSASARPDVREYVKDRVQHYTAGHAGEAPYQRGALLPRVRSFRSHKAELLWPRSERDHRHPRQPLFQHVSAPPAHAAEHRDAVQRQVRVSDPALDRRRAPERVHHEPHELHHRGQGNVVYVCLLADPLDESADCALPAAVVTSEQGWGPPSWIKQEDIDASIAKISFNVGYR